MTNRYWGILALCAALAATAPAAAATLRLRVVGEDGRPAPARLEVRGASAMYQCPGALRNGRNEWQSGRSFYLGSFTMEGECSLEAPAGRYTVVAERGLEYERLERGVELREGAPAELTLRPKRWIDMRTAGWRSADFHIHRAPEEAPLLARAEGLNLSVVFTMWNKQNYWADHAVRPGMVEIAPEHVSSLMNAEDERGGGAWMLHGLPRPMDIAVPGRWYPAGLKFIRQALAMRPKGGVLPWLDSEKLIWWECPVVVALATPDSAGVVHNHVYQYGSEEWDAWGRPRDKTKYPGIEGLMFHSMDLYYRYLNLGFRMAPSAGSASGVKPGAVGYNRVYAKPDGPFTAENWYAALKRGPSLATNGPILFAELERKGGHVVLKVDARAREAIDRVEAVSNGEVIGRQAAAPGAKTLKAEFPVDAARHSWVAARCFLKTRETVRFAHTSPVWMEGKWDARADARYFLDWIDELIRQAETDPKRFATAAERDEVVGIYREARKVYEGKAGLRQ